MQPFLRLFEKRNCCVGWNWAIRPIYLHSNGKARICTVHIISNLQCQRHSVHCTSEVHQGSNGKCTHTSWYVLSIWVINVNKQSKRQVCTKILITLLLLYKVPAYEHMKHNGKSYVSADCASIVPAMLFTIHYTQKRGWRWGGGVVRCV